MKLPILASLAVLALAGAAIAQPPPVPIASDFEGGTAESTLTPTAPGVLQSVQKASDRMQMACAADRERLCADARTSFGASRCLDRHRKDVTANCNTALNQAVVAWNSPTPH